MPSVRMTPPEDRYRFVSPDQTIWPVPARLPVQRKTVGLGYVPPRSPPAGPVGATGAGAAHFTPRVCVESAVRICPSLPTGTRASAVERPHRSPLVVSGELRPLPPPPPSTRITPL